MSEVLTEKEKLENQLETGRKLFSLLKIEGRDEDKEIKFLLLANFFRRQDDREFQERIEEVIVKEYGGQSISDEIISNQRQKQILAKRLVFSDCPIRLIPLISLDKEGLSEVVFSVENPDILLFDELGDKIKLDTGGNIFSADLSHDNLSNYSLVPYTDFLPNDMVRVISPMSRVKLDELDRRYRAEVGQIGFENLKREFNDDLKKILDRFENGVDILLNFSDENLDIIYLSRLLQNNYLIKTREFLEKYPLVLSLKREYFEGEDLLVFDIPHKLLTHEYFIEGLNNFLLDDYENLIKLFKTLSKDSVDLSEIFQENIYFLFIYYRLRLDCEPTYAISDTFFTELIRKDVVCQNMAELLKIFSEREDSAELYVKIISASQDDSHLSGLFLAEVSQQIRNSRNGFREWFRTFISSQDEAINTLLVFFDQNNLIVEKDIMVMGLDARLVRLPFVREKIEEFQNKIFAAKVVDLKILPYTQEQENQVQELKRLLETPVKNTFKAKLEEYACSALYLQNGQWYPKFSTKQDRADVVNELLKVLDGNAGLPFFIREIERLLPQAGANDRFHFRSRLSLLRVCREILDLAHQREALLSRIARDRRLLSECMERDDVFNQMSYFELSQLLFIEPIFFSDLMLQRLGGSGTPFSIKIAHDSIINQDDLAHIRDNGATDQKSLSTFSSEENCLSVDGLVTAIRGHLKTFSAVLCDMTVEQVLNLFLSRLVFYKKEYDRFEPRERDVALANLYREIENAIVSNRRVVWAERLLRYFDSYEMETSALEFCLAENPVALVFSRFCQEYQVFKQYFLFLQEYPEIAEIHDKVSGLLEIYFSKIANEILENQAILNPFTDMRKQKGKLLSDLSSDSADEELSPDVLVQCSQEAAKDLLKRQFKQDQTGISGEFNQQLLQYVQTNILKYYRYLAEVKKRVEQYRQVFHIESESDSRFEEIRDCFWNCLNSTFQFLNAENSHISIADIKELCEKIGDVDFQFIGAIHTYFDRFKMGCIEENSCEILFRLKIYSFFFDEKERPFPKDLREKGIKALDDELKALIEDEYNRMSLDKKKEKPQEVSYVDTKATDRTRKLRR